MDELQIFITYRPAWVNAEGWPLSWQHYVYGLKHIARENQRVQLWLAQAHRLSRSNQEEWDTWQRDITRVTEVPHG